MSTSEVKFNPDDGEVSLMIHFVKGDHCAAQITKMITKEEFEAFERWNAANIEHQVNVFKRPGNQRRMKSGIIEIHDVYGVVLTSRIGKGESVSQVRKICEFSVLEFEKYYKTKYLDRTPPPPPKK